MAKQTPSTMKEATTIATVGSDPFANFGVVNPPVYHASTILFKTLAEWRASRDYNYKGVRYGRSGTPTTFALQDAVAELEGGHGALQGDRLQTGNDAEYLGFRRRAGRAQHRKADERNREAISSDHGSNSEIPTK